MEKYTMFMDWKNQYSENEYTTQSNLQIQCNPYQATNGIFHRTRTNNFQEGVSWVQRLKQLPAMQETWVRSLGQEDPLEKEMATHSSTLAWKIPWMEEPGRLQSMGLQRIRHD